MIALFNGLFFLKKKSHYIQGGPKIYTILSFLK